MMSRVNFRQIRSRFSHIDAQLVKFTSSFGPEHGQAELTVRFYPWWEHPLYQEARDAGAHWGFRDVSEGAKDVTVVAVEPVICKLSQQSEVTDWNFCEEHPLTWPYQDHGELFCNSDPDIPRIIQALLARRLPHVTHEVLNDYLQPKGYRAPFSLGQFPLSLYAPLREELEVSGVRIHAPSPPSKGDSLVALLLDGDDYIVARDFEVDVPHFEHRSEWFDR